MDAHEETLAIDPRAALSPSAWVDARLAYHLSGWSEQAASDPLAGAWVTPARCQSPLTALSHCENAQ